MSKGSGGTRAGSSGNPRGLERVVAKLEGRESQIRNSVTDGWAIGPDSWGSPSARKSGKEAEQLYSALSSSVERAVDARIGNIRSGGGMSGPVDNREYVIIFRDGTTAAQIREYLRHMKTGAKLYDAWRNASGRSRGAAEDAYDKWYNKMTR